MIVVGALDIQIDENLRARLRELPVDFGKVDVAADAQADRSEATLNRPDSVADFEVLIRLPVRLSVLADNLAIRSEQSREPPSAFNIASDQGNTVPSRQTGEDTAPCRSREAEWDDDQLASLRDSPAEEAGEVPPARILSVERKNCDSDTAFIHGHRR
jgi:hypothetical protein